MSAPALPSGAPPGGGGSLRWGWGCGQPRAVSGKHSPAAPHPPSYYKGIRQMVQVSDQDMNTHLAEISRVRGGRGHRRHCRGRRVGPDRWGPLSDQVCVGAVGVMSSSDSGLPTVSARVGG